MKLKKEPVLNPGRGETYFDATGPLIVHLSRYGMGCPVPPGFDVRGSEVHIPEGGSMSWSYGEGIFYFRHQKPIKPPNAPWYWRDSKQSALCLTYLGFASVKKPNGELVWLNYGIEEHIVE